MRFITRSELKTEPKRPLLVPETRRTIAELVASWERLAAHMQKKKFERSEEAKWMATGIESCIEDMRKMGAEDSIPFEILLTPSQRNKLLKASESVGLDAYVKSKLNL